MDVNTPKARDPRFDSAAGAVNESQFKKNYAFLNEYKEKEIGALKEEIKRVKKKSTKGEERDAQEMERVLKKMVSGIFGFTYAPTGLPICFIVAFSYESGEMEDTLTGALISYVLRWT